MERFTDICTQVENDLALFVGGELEPATESVLARHIEACASCQTKARAATAAHTALRDGLCVPEAAAGAAPDLWPGIRAQLAREGRFSSPSLPRESASPAAQASSTDRMQPRTAASTSWRFAAAAAVLVAAFGWWFSSLGGETADPDRAPIAGGLTPPRSHQDEPVTATPVVSDASVKGLRRVSDGEHALLDQAVAVDPESERSRIFNGRDELQGSPVNLRFVPPRR